MTMSHPFNKRQMGAIFLQVGLDLLEPEAMIYGSSQLIPAGPSLGRKYSEVVLTTLPIPSSRKEMGAVQ